MKKAKKSLSQNFLRDKNICKKITKLTSIRNREILEIGPGYGILTDFILIEKPKRIYLVEKDNELFKYLVEKYKENKIIKVFNDDILNLKLDKFNKILVISNLPYNISTKIILKLFQFQDNISEMIFMIQKEVADKFDYNLLKLNKYKFYNKLCCFYYKCFNVPPSVFIPKPKVQSTVVKFKFNKNKIDWKKARIFEVSIFKNKRKKIYNNIRLNNESISKITNKRIDEINIKELLSIYNSF